MNKVEFGDGGAPLAGWRAASARRVFLNALTLDAEIGVHPHERGAAQPVILDIELLVLPSDAVGPAPRIVFAPPARPDDPAARDVVCYEALARMAKDIAQSGHIDYVEALVERIAERCLEDGRVIEAFVRAVKPQAIAGAAGAGVEILRRR